MQATENKTKAISWKAERKYSLVKFETDRPYIAVAKRAFWFEFNNSRASR